MSGDRRKEAGGARPSARVGATGLAALLALAGAPAAQADRVVTQGVALEGTVQKLSGSDVVLETVYGKGTLTIPLADVEALETERAFHVLHGEGERTIGALVGVGEDALLVSSGPEPVAVPFDAIFEALPAPEPDENLFERLDVELPYWSGHFDLSFGATQATDDSLSLGSELRVAREKGRHRSVFRTTYRYGTQQERGEEEDTTANELYGKLRHEYGFAERWFAFGSVDGEYDEVESLAFRTAPTVGVGYGILETEAAWLRVDGGFSWVYERFFGGEENDFPALALGAESSWDLPFAGAVWHNRIDYRPSLEEPFDDYLIRAETSLRVPLWETLSFKASVLDAYDNTPAEDNDRNSLSTTVGLSYGF